jgi:hypothetical protein
MNARVFLILSLCLNAALGGYIIYKGNKSHAPAAEAAVKPAETPGRRNAQSGKTVTITVPTTTALDWRVVESEDYKKYIANLRAIGCPEETIRDIIVADVNKLFEARKKEMSGSSTNKFEYWKTGNFFADMFNEEKLQKNRQLAKEKQALLKELLGIEVAEKPDMMGGMNPFETMLDFLPAEKQTALMNLEQDFAAKTMKRMKDLQRNPAILKEMQAEKDAELAKIMSPQEKEEYDLRMSQTAMVMRMSMGDFQPSEQEFRDIFKARKKFDDEFSVMGQPASSKPEDREKRDLAQKELDNNIKGILGEDRFREYKYDQDYSRSSLRDIATEHNVPKEQAYKVFDIKAAAQEQATAIRKDKNLSPEQRQAALDAIQQETRNAVNSALGSTAGEEYFSKGSWLKNLNRANQTAASRD